MATRERSHTQFSEEPETLLHLYYRDCHRKVSRDEKDLEKGKFANDREDTRGA